jgi:hypothetical protein
MTDETKKPDHLKLVADEEQLDAEEREFQALRRDLPGFKGAGDIGMLSITPRRQPSPKNVFFRTHPTFRPIVPLVNIEMAWIATSSP